MRKSACVFLSLISALCLSSCGISDAFSFYAKNSHTAGGFSAIEEQEAFAVEEESGSVSAEYALDIPSDEADEAIPYAPHAAVAGEKYAYDHITDEERTAYDEIYGCITEFADDVKLTTKDKNTVRNAYEAVFADNGGLFWVSGYTYHIFSRGDEVVSITFEPDYIMSKAERDRMQTEIDAVVAEWLEGVPYDASDYEKVKYVYRTLISNVDYEIGAENSQNIISVFINQKTVCQGYADAVWYMLSKLNVNSAIITGYANGEAHAWNLVVIDGEYYYLDATWGNSRYLDLNDSMQKFVNFAYLNITTEEISTTHISGMSFEISEAVSEEANYYRREGLYFDSADFDAIGGVFGSAYNNGDDIVSIKLGSSGVFHEVSKYFLEQGHLSDYCYGITGIAYLSSEETGVLTLLF